jgi:hypothetical protein
MSKEKTLGEHCKVLNLYNLGNVDLDGIVGLIMKFTIGHMILWDQLQDAIVLIADYLE